MATAPEVFKDIETLATSKNPIAVLLSIAKIRETILDFWDSLVNSIESSYYDDTSSKFYELTEQYRIAGFYKLVYVYYRHSGKFDDIKSRLDRYFEDSYYRDPDFFFFVLSKHSFYHLHFECLKIFANEPETGKAYAKLDSLEKKTTFLSKFSDRFEGSAKDMLGMPALHAFLETFACFPYEKHPEFDSKRERSGRSGRLIARDLFFASIRQERIDADRPQNEEPKGGYRKFWETYLIDNVIIKSELVDYLSNEELFDCFAYLRGKFLKAPKYNISLTSGNAYRALIDRMKIITHAKTSVKLDYVHQVDLAMGENPINRERFLNTLRKGLMFDSAVDLVDTLFGNTHLSREAFYEIKRRTKKLSEGEGALQFEHLDNVKSLAVLLDSSFLMRLARPFLIERLSSMFNKKNDLYYYVKFILSVHASKNYGEYRMLSRFFMALEAHSKPGMRGVFLRALQFGWLYFAAIATFFIAPLGTFLAIFGIAVARLVRRAIEKRSPEIALNSNFQFTGFLTVFAIVCATFGMTFARADNTAIVYSNFKTAINAVSMVASESSKLLVEDFVVKTSVLEFGEGENEKSKLDEIDYVHGKDYEKVRSK